MFSSKRVLLGALGLVAVLSLSACGCGPFGLGPCGGGFGGGGGGFGGGMGGGFAGGPGGGGGGGHP
ncbi:hypothetical protein KM176_06730 [Pseudooceanicola sp. CBS1P-1]|uniref:hypothetical protein n=1 Tax=Pseudooceanicola TaxID=1679449 RepID=UPI00192935BC|nr:MULTISPECIES: hypothetical protein [Pseudooceanicola]MBT9383545.1 hypothetical protein [Pseudooceanicola endophyticus]